MVVSPPRGPPPGRGGGGGGLLTGMNSHVSLRRGAEGGRLEDGERERDGRESMTTQGVRESLWPHTDGAPDTVFPL